MKLNDWLRRQAAAISLAMTNVEKNALGQDAKSSGLGSSSQERKTQTTSMLQALLNGEVNQEVRNLFVISTYLLLNNEYDREQKDWSL